MFKDSKLAFIGSGVMAEAMIKGLLRQELIKPEQITASHPRQERLDELAEMYGVLGTSDNHQAASQADIVVLSVKPQVLGHILPELRGALQPGALVLSIVAGAPIRKIADGLAHAAVVRSMPNTPAQIGEGITVWTATEETSEIQRAQAQAILGALGEEVFVENEGYLDMATALSGTGPAYIFLFIEAMIDAGVHLGFPRWMAERLVLQTMHGSVQYARVSPRHPATLRNQVTSPGGTSAEALYQMEKGGLRTVVSRAIWAAYQRSIALGGGSDSGSRLGGRSPNKDAEAD
jgi:pyrroline-5-carboxylate reductase